MKLFTITILLLLFSSTASAKIPTCTELQVKVECGERWELLWNVGERLKFYQSKIPVDTPLITKLKDFRAELDNMSNAQFTKQRGDEIKAQLPFEARFDEATTTAVINPEGGFIDIKTLFGAGIALIFILLGVFGFRNYKKSQNGFN